MLAKRVYTPASAEAMAEPVEQRKMDKAAPMPVKIRGSESDILICFYCVGSKMLRYL
jgi:hypothetical protein